MKGSSGGRVFRAAKDGFGLAAMGQGRYEGHLFLIFRGTTTANNKADFVTDARIGLTRSETDCPVHIGFNHTFLSMLPEIREFAIKNKAKGTVHCIGHSLGGAVATLAAGWAFGSISKSVKLYTFGQPRTGLSFFSAQLSRKLGVQNIHRVFHTTDPVPMIPIFPYVHSPLPGMGHRLSSDALITSGAAHASAEYAKSVSGKTWLELGSGHALYTHEHAIEEWLNSKKNENANCSKTYEWIEKAIFWLIKKSLSKFISVAQLAVMGVHTFVDKLAWLLAKGIELKDEGSRWIQLFMTKVMRILSVPKSQNSAYPNRSFFHFLLKMLTKRAYELAQRAIRSI